MDVGIVIIGLLGIVFGTFAVIRRDAFARRGARWDNRLYGHNRQPSEYTNTVVFAAILNIAVGAVFVLVGFNGGL